MIYPRLFFEFFKVGLFSVGGGLATIPFLRDLGQRSGWFTPADLADMIAVSESTPGPMGVNMSTYVGFTVAGPLGAVVSVLGLVAPSVLVILLVAMFLKKFRDSKVVEGIFSGLRPASTGLIAAAGLSVALIAFFRDTASPGQWTLRLLPQQANGPVLSLTSLVIALAVLVCMRVPRLKNLHPILYIAAAAVLGVVFQL